MPRAGGLEFIKLAPPVDPLARPEDCAGKVLIKRPDKRRFAASYRRIQAGRETRNICRDGHSASRFLFAGFPELHLALDRDLADIRAIAPWPSPYPQCIRSSILAPDHASGKRA